MEFDSDDEPQQPTPAVSDAVQAAATDSEVAAMQAFYAETEAEQAKLARHQENTVWDATRNAYVYDDPETGVVSVWDEKNEKWVSEKEFGGGIDLTSEFKVEEETDGPPSRTSDGKRIPAVASPLPPMNFVPPKAKGGSEGAEGAEGDEKSTAAGADNGDGAEKPAGPEKPKRKRKPRKRKKKNKSVYVEGLPPDVTMEEMVEFFRKAGVVERDPYTMAYKIRIYKDENGVPKGDALVTYLVNAFALLHEAHFRPGVKDGWPVKLSIPEFTKKEGDNANKPRARASKKLKRYDQMQELLWEEKEKLHVIIKHVFDHNVARKDIYYYDNLKKELVPEFEKCGPIHSLKIFERNPEGAIAVKYKNDWGAARCIEVMNGRFFDGRKLEAFYYDGFTNYYVAETEEEIAERDKAWAAWLDGNDEVEEQEKKKQEQEQQKEASSGDDWADT